MIIAISITVLLIVGLLLLINLITHTLGAIILFSTKKLAITHIYKFKSKFIENTIQTSDDGEINSLLFSSWKNETKGQGV